MQTILILLGLCLTFGLFIVAALLATSKCGRKAGVITYALRRRVAHDAGLTGNTKPLESGAQKGTIGKSQSAEQL